MNRYGAIARAAAMASFASLTFARESRASDARVMAIDDGEKIARDVAHALPPGPWPSGAIDLFAMRKETVAFQIVIEAGAVEARGVHVSVGALTSDEGRVLDADVSLFAERFIDVVRPTGNDRTGESLAFTAAAAPSGYVGALADPLVPIDLEGDLTIAPHTRGAIWVDVVVASDAPAGLYRGAILVRDDDGEIAVNRISLRVLDRELPYAVAKTMIYYDPHELEARIGDAGAEGELRRIFRAHHVSAIREVKGAGDLDSDADEGVLAIGAYGALGEPSAASLANAESIVRAFRERGTFDTTETFIYAIDEDCDSTWGARWRSLVRRSDVLRGVRVGVTCGRDPVAQPADLVMQTAEDLVPARARIAKEHGKWVWAYNGRRPFAGPMMLDTPAVDLRANAWIAARYGIDRWFYWESTFWLDANRGGRGATTGDAGVDPFVVAETFHNADGDYANGDGILVYPGSQRGTASKNASGMTDYGVRGVFGSVRLANIRRGVEDMGYLSLARAIDRRRADAIVRRMIPRALALAPEDSRAAWPERGASWIEARRALAAIAIESTGASDGSNVPSSVVVSSGDVVVDASGVGLPNASAARAYEPADVRDAARMSDGCAVKSFARSRAKTSAALLLALVLSLAIARRLYRSRRVLPARRRRSRGPA